MNEGTSAIRPWGRNTIVRAWRGQEPLWLVFWIYNVLAGFLLRLLLGWLSYDGLILVSLGVLLFVLVYVVWVTVAIWRCAANSVPPWSILARLIVIVGAIWAVWDVMHAFT